MVSSYVDDFFPYVDLQSGGVRMQGHGIVLPTVHNVDTCLPSAYEIPGTTITSGVSSVCPSFGGL